MKDQTVKIIEMFEERKKRKKKKKVKVKKDVCADKKRQEHMSEFRMKKTTHCE